MLHQNHCPLVIFLFHGPWRKCELNVLSRSTENELARLASLNWIPLENEKNYISKGRRLDVSPNKPPQVLSPQEFGP